MPALIVTRAFSYAPDGIHADHYPVSTEPQDVPDAPAAVALAEGWATDPAEAQAKVEAKKPAKSAAAGA